MKRILLVGGGHVHLYFMKQLINDPIKSIEIFLVSPSTYHYYSGMFSGFAEGLYHAEEIRINLEKISERANVRFIRDSIIKLAPNENSLTTKNGELIKYDVVSFDIGSETLGNDHPDFQTHARFIKPNHRFTQTIEAVRSASKPVIVGGGAAGSEISLAIQAWRNKQGLETPVSIITRFKSIRE
ncbi:NAD(P)/FAD-dependent oxidoreductase [Salipaludibacillus sp. CF4.18]|uniref:NAD(P)/FAD-dependent oxidoreductase n=1 Tax=Salipaludibacillus sp. CF4.18 TaxID=3373081 RepID=UPI003EE6773B